MPGFELSFLRDTGTQASSQLLILCTVEKDSHQGDEGAVFSKRLFFFLVITLLPPRYHFLGFCLFHRVCLPLTAKPEGKTHNLAKSFQSIYLPPTLMVYS